MTSYRCLLLSLLQLPLEWITRIRSEADVGILNAKEIIVVDVVDGLVGDPASVRGQHVLLLLCRGRWWFLAQYRRVGHVDQLKQNIS